jgi:hypothetical protein
MKKPGSRRIFFLYMLFFFAFVAFINFFHSDSILEKEPDCPACQFQQSNIALAFILFLFLVIFKCLRLLPGIDIIPVYYAPHSRKRSRAPPLRFS